MKKCYKCGEEKPFSCFYKRKSSKDGYRQECKKCSSEHARKWKEKNKKRVKKYHEEWRRQNPGYDAKWRSENKDSCCASAKKWRNSNTDKARENSREWDHKNKQRRKELSIQYSERSPEKCKARNLARSAIRGGKLTKGPCEACGSTEKVEAHHDDYSKPLDVRWLCRLHHVEHHQQEKNK